MNSNAAYAAGNNGSGNTTGLISKITHPHAEYEYTYDNMGNIVAWKQSAQITVSYVYDAMGQLIRVNDPTDPSSGSSGTTWTYEYDRGGNILNKKRYAYTTDEDPGTVLQTISYGYDTTWKDKLVSYNGATISYDAIGNPTGDGTWTYTWENGRQLKQMSKGRVGETGYQKIEYKYNAEGLRIQKIDTKTTASGTTTTTTNYTLHGKNIVHLTQGNYSLHFFYDASNKPAIVEFNGTKYGYVQNLQGDIFQIIDSNGTVVVEYTYDAWGKVLNVTGDVNLKDTLGKVQPFRYRGYVYEEDTGLYYLRSRYYNPVLERFVNADGLIGGNLYSYCYNAPTSNIDPTGRSYEPYESIVYNNSNSTVKMLTKGNPSFPYAAGNEWYYLPNNTWVNIIEDGSGMYVKVEYQTQNGTTQKGWAAKEYVDVSFSNMTAAEAFDRSTIIAPNADLRKDNYFRGNVVNIQHYLNRYYYYQYGERHHLRTDGIIDDETRRLISEFQQFYHDNFDSSLNPDGYFGEKTGIALHDYIEYELNNRG